MPVRPADVHAEQHLGPVRGLRAAGACADVEDRGPLVVLAGEQQLCPLLREVALERLGRLVCLRLELGVTRLLGQLDRGLEVIGPREDARPELDVGPEAVGLA